MERWKVSLYDLRKISAKHFLYLNTSNVQAHKSWQFSMVSFKFQRFIQSLIECLGWRFLQNCRRFFVRNSVLIFEWVLYTEAATRGVLWKRCSYKIYNLQIQGLFFNKVPGVGPATLLKRRFWYRYFPVSFAKFLRTPF